MNKYRILIVYDVHVDTPKGRIGWAFWRRASALQKYAPKDYFDVDIYPFKHAPWKLCHEYDLVFNLEMVQPNERMVKAIRDVPLCVSFNADSCRRHDMWDGIRGRADFVICNNVEVFNIRGRSLRTCAISNGIDSEIWRPVVPIENRPHKVLWAGSSNPQKGKGYKEILQPLEKILPEYGFETDFRPINDIKPDVVKTTEEMVEWYNSGSYILCASQSEGTPGIISEGVACGCVAVSAPVGNILEWGKNKENCFLVNRQIDEFVTALVVAKQKREEVSRAGAELFKNNWSYGPPAERAHYYFSLFRKIIEYGPGSVQPFSYAEKHWSEI